jgi:integrase
MPAITNFAELMEFIGADQSLSPQRRAEICSALRLIARASGRRLAEIPANPAYLRKLFATLTPAMAGVSVGRWANACSLARAALKHAGLATIPGRSTLPLGPEWRALHRYLNERRLREALSRFFHYCTALSISPSEVNDRVSSEFLKDLETEGVIRKPRQVHRSMCIAWNRASRTIAPWPSTLLTVPGYRQDYALTWDSFPVSLRNEFQAYLDRLAGKDPLEELDFRPLRPSSICTYERLMRAFVSALVLRGCDPQTLNSLADVVDIATVKIGLRFFIDRAGGNKSKQAFNIARLLTAIARYWVKVERDHLGQLQAICRRLDSGKSGTMSGRNRARLRQFENPANLDSILLLPVRTLARYRSRNKLTRADALKLQFAVGLELLLMLPLRSQNLTNLRLDQNVVRTTAKGRAVVHIFIPAQDVKNGLDIESELPPQSVELLDHYLNHARPLLATDPSPYLFPNTKGGHKAQNTLASQIARFVHRECGVRVNLHLFRHLAAAHYLAEHPGDYGTIKNLLRHASVETTTRSYCGTETAAAVRHFDRHVLRLRERALTVAELQDKGPSGNKKPHGKVAR